MEYYGNCDIASEDEQKLAEEIQKEERDTDKTGAKCHITESEDVKILTSSTLDTDPQSFSVLYPIRLDLGEASLPPTEKPNRSHDECRAGEATERSDDMASSPIFSKPWQDCSYFSAEGGRLQVQGSDVVLQVPAGVIDDNTKVAVHVAICANDVYIKHKLQLPVTETIVSPLAEFKADHDFCFQNHIQITLPTCLSSDYDVNLLHVYCITHGGQEEEINISEIQRLEDMTQTPDKEALAAYFYKFARADEEKHSSLYTVLEGEGVFPAKVPSHTNSSILAMANAQRKENILGLPTDLDISQSFDNQAEEEPDAEMVPTLKKLVMQQQEQYFQALLAKRSEGEDEHTFNLRQLQKIMQQERQPALEPETKVLSSQRSSSGRLYWKEGHRDMFDIYHREKLPIHHHRARGRWKNKGERKHQYVYLNRGPLWKEEGTRMQIGNTQKSTHVRIQYHGDCDKASDDESQREQNKEKSTDETVAKSHVTKSEDIEILTSSTMGTDPLYFSAPHPTIPDVSEASLPPNAKPDRSPDECRAGEAAENSDDITPPPGWLAGCRFIMISYLINLLDTFVESSSTEGNVSRIVKIVQSAERSFCCVGDTLKRTFDVKSDENSEDDSEPAELQVDLIIDDEQKTMWEFKPMPAPANTFCLNWGEIACVNSTNHPAVKYTDLGPFSPGWKLKSKASENGVMPSTLEAFLLVSHLKTQESKEPLWSSAPCQLDVQPLNGKEKCVSNGTSGNCPVININNVNGDVTFAQQLLTQKTENVLYIMENNQSTSQTMLKRLEQPVDDTSQLPTKEQQITNEETFRCTVTRQPQDVDGNHCE
ncbi:hypothetical protein C0Q70_03561 [Pomacea canaliculata]|uniref:ZU5 domain-containing protein n=1 Tax=Pomacea canaliculata TaxID=400727 RepID=A0A2T7PT25_POMCA|nr:hypothetical protein C0Q70_03561 [Pomacea canaliculata]